MSGYDYVALQHHQSVPRSARLCDVLDRLCRTLDLSVAHQGLDQVVLTRPGTPCVRLPAGSGLVVGHLFDRATSARIVEPGSAMDGPIERFVQRHWGGYVAFRSTPDGAEAWRDPSGMVPCYRISLDDAQIFTSTPAMLIKLGLVEAHLDWEVLRQSLIYRDLKAARTLLRNVHELLPGVAFRRHAKGTETRGVWSPWDFITPTADLTFHDATAAVAETVTASIGAWARCFDRPLLEISGGLDSAIVAAVAAAHAPSAAVTFAPITGDPDETPYAAAVADASGVALTIIAPAIDRIEVTRSNAAGLPRAYARCFAQDFDRRTLNHAQRLDADVIFSGGGGDNVFCHLQSLSPLLDRLHSEGLKPGLMTTIADLAMLGNTTVWDITARALRRLMRPHKAPWYVDGRLLRTDAVQATTFPEGHPWTRIPRGVPAGKIAHIAALIAFQNHLEGHARAAWAPIISPLLSQPIMETCLAIPSWFWCSGGANRAVARAAFARTLPASVLARQTKGAFDSLAAQLLAANRAQVRDLVLGGYLAAEGLLDEPAVLRALDTADPSLTVRLWHLVDTEAWAQSWPITVPRAMRPGVPPNG